MSLPVAVMSCVTAAIAVLLTVWGTCLVCRRKRSVRVECPPGAPPFNSFHPKVQLSVVRLIQYRCVHTN